MPRTKTEDFGEKIGGARKDLWAVRGLLSSDLSDMTDYEKKEYINKNNIWKKPDYDALAAEGRSREAVYFIKLVRDALPAKFSMSSLGSMTRDEQYKLYIDFIQEFKNLVMEVRTLDDVDKLKNYLEESGKIKFNGYRGYSVDDKYWELVSNKLVNVMCLYNRNISKYRRDILKKQFCYSEFEKALTNYTVIFYHKESTCINFKAINTLSLAEIKRITHPWISGIEVSTAGVNDKSKKVGIYLPQEDIQKIIEEVNNGEYLVLSNGKYLFKTSTKEEALNKAYAHYKESHKEEPIHQVSSKKRKELYVPPQLRHINRHGPVYRTNNKNVTGDKILDDFRFRGGEFGNWLNETERKQSLNYCYDALMDLSYALGVQPTDISFNGSLAIAFGSRGHGGKSAAVAHYEPARQVINLTKMRGAGSLGHEWIHAMDHAIAAHYAGTTISLATQASYSVRKEVPAEFFEIMKTIKSCENYMNAAKDLDEKYGKSGHGYWKSDCELLARAGACWIHDRLTAVGIKNDYLVGHSEGIKISPHGEERERINLAFNNFLDKAKEIGFFNHEYLLPGRSQDMNIILGIPSEIDAPDRIYDPTVEYTQVSFFDLLETVEQPVSDDIEV